MSDQPHQLKKPFLYIVVCPSGIAGDVGKLITAAQERHWDVGVVATPYALGFTDVQAIEVQTGYPIRSAGRTPSEPRPLPSADAIAVAPATFNTINKCSSGCSAWGGGVLTCGGARSRVGDGRC
ncbi:hypothetical protein K7C20_37675 [Streptomyces decoyicus]|nr:hypothetical protein K7C20_37675 [Streptomyces decoyicus]